MDELTSAIEELREARQSYEALLREHKEIAEHAMEVGDRCTEAEQRMKECAAEVGRIVDKLASEGLPINLLIDRQ